MKNIDHQRAERRTFERENMETKIGNALRLLVSDQTGETLVLCKGSHTCTGRYADYVRGWTSGFDFPHRALVLYADSRTGWTPELAQTGLPELVEDMETHNEGITVADLHVEDTDEEKLLAELLAAYNDHGGLVSDFVERFMPDAVFGHEETAITRLKDYQRRKET